MKQKNLMLLMGLTTASVLAGGILAPAQAALVTYNINGAFNDGSLIKGSFQFDGTTYQNANIKTFAKTSGVGTFAAKTYTTIQGSPTSSTISFSESTTSPNGLLSLSYNPLTASIPDNATLLGSNEIQITLPLPPGPVAFRNVTSGTVTAVPFDTPALPIMGSTLLFGFGIWAKNKKGQTQKVDLSA